MSFTLLPASPPLRIQKAIYTTVAVKEIAVTITVRLQVLHFSTRSFKILTRSMNSEQMPYLSGGRDPCSNSDSSSRTLQTAPVKIEACN